MADYNVYSAQPTATTRTGYTGGTGGSAVAPALNFSSLLLPGVASFLPALLTKLFHLGGDSPDEIRRKISKLTSSANIGRLTDKYYQQNIGSPAYSQAQGAIATGANQAAGDIARGLASRGLSTSGIAALAPAIGASSVGGQQAQLRTTAYGQAQGQAQDEIKRLIDALTSQQGPSPGAQALGAGFEQFAPFLQQYLRSQYPQMFAQAA